MRFKSHGCKFQPHSSSRACIERLHLQTLTLASFWRRHLVYRPPPGVDDHLLLAASETDNPSLSRFPEYRTKAALLAGFLWLWSSFSSHLPHRFLVRPRPRAVFMPAAVHRRNSSSPSPPRSLLCPVTAGKKQSPPLPSWFTATAKRELAPPPISLGSLFATSLVATMGSREERTATGKLHLAGYSPLIRRNPCDRRA